MLRMLRLAGPHGGCAGLAGITFRATGARIVMDIIRAIGEEGLSNELRSFWLY